MEIDTINFRKDVERIKNGVERIKNVKSIEVFISERKNKISQLIGPKEIEKEELIIECILCVFQE